MHYGASIGAAMRHDAKIYGWSAGGGVVDWSTLTAAVNNHIRMLNFSYRRGLIGAGVKYINARARLLSPHEIAFTDGDNAARVIRAGEIVIACGGRPTVPLDIPGAGELAITSDDVFWRKQPPGKTLVVGGSYIALECAGFLLEMGYPVTLAVRSIFLRGFDRQCSSKIGSLLLQMGAEILRPCTPKEMTKGPNGKILVSFNEDFPTGEFDTVLFATGRHPDIEKLGLAEAGVRLSAKGKIIAPQETSSVSSIHAIGDVVDGRPELTPVAIRAGELL
eukprot:Polyplicarium_translucidae@DN694_c0_g1_i1.p1